MASSSASVPVLVPGTSVVATVLNPLTAPVVSSTAPSSSIPLSVPAFSAASHVPSSSSVPAGRCFILVFCLFC